LRVAYAEKSNSRRGGGLFFCFFGLDDEDELGLRLALGLGWSDWDEGGGGCAAGAGTTGREGEGDGVVVEELWGIEGPASSLMRAISSSRVQVS
jgi:hypothetical protein